MRGLVKDGVVTGDTLVWREGMANWQPYRTQTAPATLPSSVGVTPGEPGTGVAPGSGAVTTGNPSNDDYSSTLSDCFSRGIDHAMKHLSVTYLAVLPVSLVIFVVQGLQVIPFAGSLLAMMLAWLLNNAMVGGIWRHVLGLARGQPATDGIFSGFQHGYFHLTLGGLVRSTLAILSLGPGLMLMGLAAGAAMVTGNLMVAGGGMLLGALVVMAGLPVTFYLLTCWGFMLPLVADKGLGFWEAMQASRRQVRKHWWSNFVLLALLTFIVLTPILLLSAAFGPSADFKDIKQMVEAFKQGKLTMSPEQVLLTNGLNTLWLWLVSPFYFGILAVRYRDIFDREAAKNAPEATGQ